MMRFYKQPHRFYCGIDLHARTLYLCVFDLAGHKLLHKEVPSNPHALLDALAPFRDNLVIACECMFAWYWVADLCARERIAFVLAHALYLKAIHGGKAKNDRIDSEKIADLLRGGNRIRGRRPNCSPAGRGRTSSSTTRSTRPLWGWRMSAIFWNTW